MSPDLRRDGTVRDAFGVGEPPRAAEGVGERRVDPLEAFGRLLGELHALGLELSYVARQSSVARAPTPRSPDARSSRTCAAFLSFTAPFSAFRGADGGATSTARVPTDDL
jgi:hypothetical protein